ncbi:MAG TPA: hypothetical protein VF411_08530 [Bacteroidia bacterium]
MFKYITTVLFAVIFCKINAQTKNQTDDKGLKQGYWEKIDTETGKISYKGTFKNNKPQGIFSYYYKGTDSLRSKSEFRQDGKVAYATMYHLATGKIQAKGKYVSEAKDSLWNFYDERGNLLSTEIYLNGKKNGASKVYYTKGAILEEKSYKNDLPEGAFKQFYEDKRTKAEGAYLAGEYTGKCSWYYPNGMVAAEGFYEKGIKKGVWLYKEQSGKIKEKEVWQNGKQLNQKEMDAFFKSKNITFPADTKTNTKTAPQKTITPKTNSTPPKK